MDATDLTALHDSISSRLPYLRSGLKALVEQESPSDHKPSVDAAVSLIETLASSLHPRIKRHKQKHFGDILELRFGPRPRSSSRKPLLVLAHLDTVWPLGTLTTMPFREHSGRLHGPGVLDMKAGIAMALTALAALADLNLLPPVIFLLNSEEEIGSPVSRPFTERLAHESRAVFVLEPAQSLAFKTSRKGIAHYTLEVTGVPAHSGVDFDRGHSAIREMARLVEAVSEFTDSVRRRTVNVGTIAGGSRSNIVPARCTAEVDVRVATAADAARVDRLFRRLRASDPHCTLKISGGLNRPPMERLPGTAALFKQARSLADQLGFPLDEASTGGGSDGNFTAALGIPTLDGMGAVGEGAHAPHEHILTAHLLPRATLLAAMIAATP